MTGRQFKKSIGLMSSIYMDVENEQFYIPLKLAVDMPYWYRRALQAVEQRDMDQDEEMYVYQEIEAWANDDMEVWDLFAEEFGKICITEE